MTSKQTSITIIYGLAGWFVAAQFLWLIGPQAFTLGLAHALILLLAVIIAYPTIWLGSRLTGIAMQRMLAPTALFTATAALADSFAITYMPGLYGGPGANLAYSGAVILCGVGALLAVAVLLDRP